MVMGTYMPYLYQAIAGTSLLGGQAKDGSGSNTGITFSETSGDHRGGEIVGCYIKNCIFSEITLFKWAKP